MAIDKRRQRLEVIIERLEKGEEVSLRDYKNAMPADEYGSYEQAVDFRTMELSGIFGYCTDYEKWLKKGIFEYNRAEGFWGKNNKNYTKFHERAQDCFQHAIQALREEFGRNPDIVLAYDRGVELDAGVGGAGGLDPHSMPRLKSSKSHMSFERDNRKINKRKLKIEAAQRALVDLNTKEQTQVITVKKSNKIKSEEKSLSNLKNLQKPTILDRGMTLREMLRKLAESEGSG